MYGLVSVIMPSYNTGKYIAESILSVINQTYSNWELIIVDDCSTDDTDQVVARFLGDKRIRYLKNEHNSGAAISRNLALREATGEWIAFLDSDDLWFPEKLEKQLCFMRQHHYFFSGTGRIEIDEDSHPIGRQKKSPKHVGKVQMYMYCWPGCLTVMYHAPTVGLIQIENLKKRNDYAMWLKVIKKCDFYYLDEILASYRVRKGSISHDKIRKLIHSHYLLFRMGEKMNPISSFGLTIINMFFSGWKKLFYVKKYSTKEQTKKEIL